MVLSSLVAPEVVVTTTSGATSDDKVGIMTTLDFQCPISLWDTQQVKQKHNCSSVMHIKHADSFFNCELISNNNQFQKTGT